MMTSKLYYFVLLHSYYTNCSKKIIYSKFSSDIIKIYRQRKSHPNHSIRLNPYFLIPFVKTFLTRRHMVMVSLLNGTKSPPAFTSKVKVL